MPNNLTQRFTNAYWRVTESFFAYVLMGNYPSNTHFGASQAYGNIYCHTMLHPGEEIHALTGGTFLISEGEPPREVHIELSEKHPFEKVYIPRQEKWPLDSLEQITNPSKPDGGYRSADDSGMTLDEAKRFHAEPHGRSIDYVYDN